MKRKAVILSLVGLVFLVGVCVLFLYPWSLVDTPYQISDAIRSETDVVITGVGYDGEDVTDTIDHSQLMEILSRYTCRFGLKRLGNFALKNTFTVDLIQGGRPLHIVLGERSLCYSGDGIYWSIIDAEQLRAELCSLLDP